MVPISYSRLHWHEPDGASTMRHTDSVQALLQTKLLAIIRTRDTTHLLPSIEAVIEGGVRVIEITLTVPDALTLIPKCRSITEKQGAFFGAGTVLDAETARLAITQGAQFLVSPILKHEVIEMGLRYGVAVIPGAATPTEMQQAQEWGAPLVKVFPAAPLGGPDFVKAVLNPLPHLRLIPTGSITPQNARLYLDAGCIAVGSAYMMEESLLLAAQLDEVSRRSRQMVDAVNYST